MDDASSAGNIYPVQTTFIIETHLRLHKAACYFRELLIVPTVKNNVIQGKHKYVLKRLKTYSGIYPYAERIRIYPTVFMTGGGVFIWTCFATATLRLDYLEIKPTTLLKIM